MKNTSNSSDPEKETLDSQTAEPSNPAPEPDVSPSNPALSLEDNKPEPVENPNHRRLWVLSSLLAAAVVLVLLLMVVQRLQSSLGWSLPLAQANSRGAQSGGEGDADASITLQPLITPADWSGSISRQVEPRTIIPNRPRVTVVTYTVQLGDNLFTIADAYSLQPETLLWGNFETLQDNPEVLQIDQVLNVLPVDGTYYKWKEQDTLGGVASFFKVEPDAIINYPGNHLDLTTSITGTEAIEPGTWLIIPGGKRAFKDWGPPAISRSNPAVARYYGPGSCGSIYEGAIGDGVFAWPTTSHFISGYTYTSIHHAIDIGGQIGNAIYAADGGVVVYAGWSNYGYGNLVVIDHGNGWQTAYAHLNSIGVSCGQSVSRGIMIAALGSTGNSSGPHLHFEMGINGAKVNPMDYLP